jgi:hypothetical protein
MSPVATKGKWQQGIVPRNFHWIIRDRLAVCERPGGYGQNHRRVRRQEEIIWIREQGFTCVISLIPAPHNLHNYDELDVAWAHWPFSGDEETLVFLGRTYPELRAMLAEGGKVLLHLEEVSDRVCGFLAGYLLWSGLVATGPEVITVIERMTSRQLGPQGRELVAAVESLRAG